MFQFNKRRRNKKQPILDFGWSWEIVEKRTQEMSCIPSLFSPLLRLFTEWGHYFPTEPKNKTTRAHYISSYLSCQKKKALSFDNPSNSMDFVSKELSLEQKEEMRNTNKK